MDYTRTNNPVSLFKAASVHPLPEWADSSPIPHVNGLEGVSNAAFADTTNRLLPLHTKAAAFFSMVDFLDRPEVFGLEIGERVKNACVNYGIMDDMLPYLRVADDSFEKSASTVPFAIDTEIGQTRVRLFPLGNAEDVREAVYGLTKMANEKRIDYTLLRDASLEVIKVAAVHGEVLNTLVSSFAITRFVDPEKSASLVSGRGATPAEQKAYNEICRELANGGDPEDAVMKIAATDIAFNRGNHPYASTRLRPHDIVYCGDSIKELEKAAAENVFVMDIMVPMKSLAAIERVDLDFGLTKSAADSFDASLGGVALADRIAAWSEADQKTLLHLALNA